MADLSPDLAKTSGRGDGPPLRRQQPPCDYLRLDLGGTLDDAKDAVVAQHAAGRGRRASVVA